MIVQIASSICIVLLYAMCNYPAKVENEKTSVLKDSTSNFSEVDFLNECDNMESWIGAIQGLDSSQRVLLGFKSCESGSNSFDIIMKLKQGLPQNELTSRFDTAEVNSYADFNVFAFTISMKDSQGISTTDTHEDPNIYPSVVNAYFLDKKQWRLVTKKKITSLKEYGIFQLSTIMMK